MMEISKHVFGEDGRCVWCHMTKAEVTTVNCPSCPYDNGCAYCEEVGE